MSPLVSWIFLVLGGSTLILLVFRVDVLLENIHWKSREARAERRFRKTLQVLRDNHEGNNHDR